MKLTSKEQYGLRVMVELARHYGTGPVSLAQVAEAQQLPLPYLEQIVVLLKQAELLKSIRGAHGGYELAFPPQRISVADVIRAIEGTIFELPCIEESSGAHCERQGICAVRNVWEIVHQRLASTMDEMTLSSLLGTEPACNP